MISALTIKSLNPNRWPFSCYNYRKSYCLVDQISDGVTGQRGPPGNDACCLLFVFVCVCWWWPLTETQTTHIREKTCSVFKRDHTFFCLKELTDVFLDFHPVKIRRYWFKKKNYLFFPFFAPLVKLSLLMFTPPSPMVEDIFLWTETKEFMWKEWINTWVWLLFWVSRCCTVGVLFARLMKLSSRRCLQWKIPLADVHRVCVCSALTSRCSWFF